MARRRKSGIPILRVRVLHDYLFNVLYALRRMIRFIAVDPEILEKATKDHLALMRAEFDRESTPYTKQYDIAANARLFYGDRLEVIALENDLKQYKKHQ